MGIRVHKDLGWAYKGELDLSKIEGIKYNDFIKKFNLDDIVDRTEFLFPGVKEKDLLLTDCITEITDYDGDDEFTAFTLFTPPMQLVTDNWSRYDDAMDYLENQDGRTKIKYIHRDLFPYVGKYAVTHSSNILTTLQKDRVQLFGSIPTEKWDPKIKEEFEKLGLDISLPMNVQIHQAAPRVIEEIFKLLSNESYLVLRPAIITHWG